MPGRCGPTSRSPRSSAPSAPSRASTCASGPCSIGWHRGCAHVFLCLLAYHVEWHMRRKLAPMLYEDDDRAGGEALRESVVGPAQRSPAARSKQTRGVTPDGLPVHSFRTLLADLATLTRNTVEMPLEGARALTIYARPTAVQQKAFALLGISPERTQ